MTKIDFESFEQKRLALILDLESGGLDKSAFLERSFALFEGSLYAEPDAIRSVEEGIFYYFYFNTMAKSYMRRSKAEDGARKAYISNEYYRIKEEILFKLLALFADEELSAYYVKTDSVKLRNNLVEILVKNREKLIFHTLNPKTISLLRRRRLLEEGVRRSGIESYINKKYY